MLASQNWAPSHQTKVCISLSTKPGRLGSTIHNAGYRALNLDYLYKAFFTQDIAGALVGIRALGIRGCSISMPFKESVMSYLDSIDDEADKIGAVNTIVNDEGHLKGFNTDVTGVMMALKPHLIKPSEKILILGGGGMARSILQALNRLEQREITLCVREPQKCLALAKQFSVALIDWPLRHSTKASILINATPMGMAPPDNALPIDIEKMHSVSLVMDVVVGVTPLVELAKARHLKTVDGLSIALHQAYEQFYLYTGMMAPRDVMYQAAMTLR